MLELTETRIKKRADDLRIKDLRLAELVSLFIEFEFN
jgi:hypothetical protein